MIAIEFEQQRRAFAIGDTIRGRVRWSQLQFALESIEIRS